MLQGLWSRRFGTSDVRLLADCADYNSRVYKWNICRTSKGKAALGERKFRFAWCCLRNMGIWPWPRYAYSTVLQAAINYQNKSVYQTWARHYQFWQWSVGHACESYLAEQLYKSGGSGWPARSYTFDRSVIISTTAVLLSPAFHFSYKNAVPGSGYLKYIKWSCFLDIWNYAVYSSFA